MPGFLDAFSVPKKCLSGMICNIRPGGLPTSKITAFEQSGFLDAFSAKKCLSGICNIRGGSPHFQDKGILKRVTKF